jgi:hypothetical protein
MEPFVIEELKRREEEESRREIREVRIPLDAPDSMGQELECPETPDAPRRGVLIIPL